MQAGVSGGHFGTGTLCPVTPAMSDSSRPSIISGLFITEKCNTVSLVAKVIIITLLGRASGEAVWPNFGAWQSKTQNTMGQNTIENGQKTKKIFTGFPSGDRSKH